MNIRHYLNRVLCAAAILLASAPALAADVGVSISVGQPGFYGHIDIGGYPAPPIIYSEPIIVHRSAIAYEPIFLHVPPGHAKRWHRYCGRYSACGRPVYFVEDGWYNEVYVPQYRERHGEHGWGRRGNRDHGDYRGHGNGHGRGRDRD